MEERYLACMILHAVGDTIGYKNGEWEFKQGGLDSSRILEKLYEFIDLGGVKHINLKGWIVSDDTILHIQTAEALLEGFNNINTLGKIMSNKLIEALEQFDKEGYNLRNPGLATLKYIKRLKNGGNWIDTPYDLLSGGSGAAMRNLCIGLAYFGENNRHKLIQISIEMSRITHNSAVGYLGGLASALFVALSIEKININSWPFILLELFKNGTIKKYIKASNRGINEYENDSHIFINKWEKYISDKFDENGNPIKRKTDINLLYRNKYYRDNFAFRMESDSNPSHFIGGGGDDSVIIAYDCLLDSGPNWEKLIIYSMLHAGDSDTTGAIAAGFYGSLYGFKDVSENFLENLEFHKKLKTIGFDLYQKFYLDATK